MAAGDMESEMTSTTETTDLSTLSGSYTIDPAHSRIGFVARHAMVTKVRGAFNDFTGAVTLDGVHPENSAATVTIKAASIDTRNEQRDQHLRSNDFLAMDEYPEITFVSTGARQTGSGSDARSGEFELTGDLTVRGVTRQVMIPFSYEGSATDPFGNFRAGFEGSVTISRKDYGVTWNAALEGGGVLVSDKVTLEFEISAIRNA
jgi:polyisoprenoid-binding protein YceI